MSKKAEEKALKEYPVDMTPLGDDNRAGREAYVKGYEQAEKDMIERACRWMLGNLATYFGHSPVYQQDMINDFRKAMEEEL